MKLRDFGHFDGPVLLVGGVFGNIDAFSAFTGMVAGRPVIGTGDLAAIGPAGEEAVTAFADAAWPTVAGASDLAALEDLRDPRSSAWGGPDAPALSDAAIRALSALPTLATFVQVDRRYAVLGGGVPGQGAFLWPTSSEALFREQIGAIEEAVGPVDGIVAGGTGLAFHRNIDAHQWINPGAIGLPSHDGRPETRYAVLTAGDVMIERLTYDAVGAAERARRAGATEPFAAIYETGIWPDEQVLPDALRRKT
ncbi:metallophosphoesterase [Alphaproteobacteria bacterium GH1-50]|uniref:Metallophosphoesterase n=1 Tax=Kangsaoukella pontilimi TaxID=2691042 RepID=A0A7C9MAL9_9RHOB|nr:metallophosphoesterase [Kangsaoukella pontilimi]MXQ06271.1 metallophosphoesterase [Kangsaoukella pontilimi]